MLRSPFHNAIPPGTVQSFTIYWSSVVCFPLRNCLQESLSNPKMTGGRVFSLSVLGLRTGRKGYEVLKSKNNITQNKQKKKTSKQKQQKRLYQSVKMQKASVMLYRSIQCVRAHLVEMVFTLRERERGGGVCECVTESSRRHELLASFSSPRAAFVSVLSTAEESAQSGQWGNTKHL